MPLQKQVNLYRAPGVAGDKATPDQSVYTPLNPLAAKSLPVGSFVFPVVSSDVIDNTQATNGARPRKFWVLWSASSTTSIMTFFLTARLTCPRVRR